MSFFYHNPEILTILGGLKNRHAFHPKVSAIANKVESPKEQKINIY